MNFNLDLMLPYKDEVKAAINRVIESRQYLYGPEVERFEHNWAGVCSAPHAVAVGSGTDAIRLALEALGIGPGDEVLTPANGVAHTAMAILATGARPVFVDISPATWQADPRTYQEAITPKTRAVVPVYLYGAVSYASAIVEMAKNNGLVVVEDACHAHGAATVGKGDAVAWSFYPTKNLGCLGEGGAVTTRIPAVAETIRRMRDAGRVDRYIYQDFGINSGMDEIQAAVLNVKLNYLLQRLRQRNEVAKQYRYRLRDHAWLSLKPILSDDVHHLFPIRTPFRDMLRFSLGESGIPVLIHYPLPVPHQPAFAGDHYSGTWPVTEQHCREVLSLPLHADMTEYEVNQVADAIDHFAETQPNLSDDMALDPDAPDRDCSCPACPRG